MKSESLKAKRLELIGLLLVLVSSFFQLFGTEQTSSHLQSAVTFKVEEKLDVIYQLVKANYQKVHHEPTKIRDSWLDSKLNYKYAEMNQQLEKVESQDKFTKNLYGALFLLGSLLILRGKWIEYRVDGEQ
ncbi:hypothetical protein L4D11_05625 [Vibrio gigantis]|uniref:hypothetical protein n=1 Tax=Vibrio gigantis TaxID=296199 RepID=UPI003D0D2540